jgi:hypothetical protein
MAAAIAKSQLKNMGGLLLDPHIAETPLIAAFAVGRGCAPSSLAAAAERR